MTIGEIILFILAVIGFIVLMKARYEELKKHRPKGY
jgi:hypothetical protein